MHETQTGDEYRMLSARQILKWVDDDSQIMRLRSDRDVIPGGYMAAGIPVLVDWAASDPHADKPHVVLRHVNYGGNPLERTTVLHCVRVPLDGIERVEFTLVPFGEGGRVGPLQHVQLRFIFESGNQPQLVDLAGAETGTDAQLSDLVFGWTSWRRPNDKWELRRGMDDEDATYWLSLRAVAGSQMFLEDALKGRDWFSYPLSLPGGRDGLIELFKFTVTLGDGVARDTISRMLETGEETWLRHTPPATGNGETNIQSQWQELLERIRASDPLALAPVNLPPSQDTYHPLVRSCATLARHTVLLTVKRLVARGQSDGINLDKLPEPFLGTTEAWMREVAHTDLRGVFLRAPVAVRYIMRHHESLPPDIPAELDAAGLLERHGGKRLRIHYSRSGTTPYGRAFFV